MCWNHWPLIGRHITLSYLIIWGFCGDCLDHLVFLMSILFVGIPLTVAFVFWFNILKHIYKEVGAIGKNSGCKYCAVSVLYYIPCRTLSTCLLLEHVLSFTSRAVRLSGILRWSLRYPTEMFKGGKAFQFWQKLMKSCQKSFRTEALVNYCQKTTGILFPITINSRD